MLPGKGIGLLKTQPCFMGTAKGEMSQEMSGTGWGHLGDPDQLSILA